MGTQPTNQTGVVGDAGKAFTIAATGGTGTLTYQWQVQTGGTGAWANVTGGTGATTATYTTATLASNMNGNKYKAIVKDANNVTVESNGNATLTVNPAPVAPTFTTDLAGPTTATAGTAFTTTPAIVVAGTPTPTIKWQSADGASGGTFTDISGETGTTLTVSAPVAGTKRYKAVATNSAGSKDSAVIAVVTT